MERELKVFLATLLALCGIIGGYFALVPLGLEWVFLAAVALAAGIAFWRRLVWPFRALAGYAALQRSEKELRDRNSSLSSDLAAASVATVDAYRLGKSDGQKSVLGSILASSVQNPPTLTGIKLNSGTLEVFANRNDDVHVPQGARFVVEVIATGERRGVVEVIESDPSTRQVVLSCVEDDAEPFWRSLYDRANIDATAPDDVRLTHETGAFQAESPESSETEISEEN